jgi:hypothetical protein
VVNERWQFWVRASRTVAAAVLVFVLPPPPTRIGRAAAYCVSGGLIVGVLGFRDQRRFPWAFRIVAMGIFLGCGFNLAGEFQEWRAGKPFFGRVHRSYRDLFTALCAFGVIGPPTLRYALRGRSEWAIDGRTPRNRARRSLRVKKRRS